MWPTALSIPGLPTPDMNKAVKRFTRNINAMIGLVLTIILVVVAFSAPALVVEDPLQIDFSMLSQKLEPPGESSLLGRDNFGRDLYSRIVMGTRVSLMVGFIAV